MQLPRSIGAGLSLIVLLAACSGSPAATVGPGTTTNPGGGGGATTNPGGGGGGAGSGTVKYDVAGTIQKSGELPFFAFGSRFDRGGPTGLSLTFTTEDGAILSILQSQGAHSISLVDEEHGLTWMSCATFDVNVTGTSATGRFECSQGFGTVLADGSMVTDVRISATFDARS